MQKMPPKSNQQKILESLKEALKLAKKLNLPGVQRHVLRAMTSLEVEALQ